VATGDGSAMGVGNTATGDPFFGVTIRRSGSGNDFIAEMILSTIAVMRQRRALTAPHRMGWGFRLVPS